MVLHSILREEFSWHCSELAEEYLSRELMRYLEGTDNGAWAVFWCLVEYSPPKNLNCAFWMP